MNPTALFIVTADPRVSACAAEAVRIAAGVGAWKKVEVTLYLRDAAVLALGEFADELIDGENFTRYLPLLVESGRPLLVQRGSPFLAELGEGARPFTEFDDAQLAAHAAQSRYLLRF
jgi:hypothetical protein